MNIVELIKNENIKAKKKFGQNFLIDQNILNNIITKAEISGKNVIEIGPGLGSLTEYLIRDAKKVVCYEIDKDMVDILEDRHKEGSITINKKVRLFSFLLFIDKIKKVYLYTFTNYNQIIS